jgi:Predicted membrane protein
MKEIEKNLKSGLEKLTTNLDDSFLLQIENEERGVIVEKQNRRKFTWLKYGLMPVCAALIIGLFIGTNYFSNNNNNLSIVQIDVNPSIEIKVTAKNEIVEVNALNEDAKIILTGMELRNTNLETTINALIGSMIKNGYIDELANSILVSVENADDNAATRIKQDVLNDINSYFNQSSVDGSVVTQTISNTADSQDLARQYNISIGRVNLIQSIIQNNNLLNFGDLVKLSINELNILAQENVSASNINISGNASDKGYIGGDAALDIALNDAGLTRDNVTVVKNFFDYEDGQIVYDVEFFANGQKYEYEINATTGLIVSFDFEDDNRYNTMNNSNNNNNNGTGNNNHSNNSNNSNNHNNNSNNAASNYIGNARALEIALNHVGAPQNNVRDIDVELEGNAYEVSFDYNGYEYEYMINSTTGEILWNTKERD